MLWLITPSCNPIRLYPPSGCNLCPQIVHICHSLPLLPTTHLVLLSWQVTFVIYLFSFFFLYFPLFRFLFFILPQNTLAWLWQAAVKCSISVCGKCVCACVMCVCACVCVWGGALHMSKSKTISGAKQKLLNVWWSRFAVCANKIYTDNRSIKNAHTRTHTYIRVNIQLWPAV